MKQAMAKGTDEICQRFGNDRTRMMDIVLEVQARFGCVSHEAMEQIARAVNTYRVEVESLVTFYSFLSVKPQGQVVIRLWQASTRHPMLHSSSVFQPKCIQRHMLWLKDQHLI